MSDLYIPVSKSDLYTEGIKVGPDLHFQTNYQSGIESLQTEIQNLQARAAEAPTTPYERYSLLWWNSDKRLGLVQGPDTNNTTVKALLHISVLENVRSQQDAMVRTITNDGEVYIDPKYIQQVDKGLKVTGGALTKATYEQKVQKAEVDKRKELERLEATRNRLRDLELSLRTQEAITQAWGRISPELVAATAAATNENSLLAGLNYRTTLQIDEGAFLIEAKPDSSRLKATIEAIDPVNGVTGKNEGLRVLVSARRLDGNGNAVDQGSLKGYLEVETPIRGWEQAALHSAGDLQVDPDGKANVSIRVGTAYATCRFDAEPMPPADPDSTRIIQRYTVITPLGSLSARRQVFDASIDIEPHGVEGTYDLTEQVAQARKNLCEEQSIDPEFLAGLLSGELVQQIKSIDTLDGLNALCESIGDNPSRLRGGKVNEWSLKDLRESVSMLLKLDSLMDPATHLSYYTHRAGGVDYENIRFEFPNGERISLSDLFPISLRPVSRIFQEMGSRGVKPRLPVRGRPDLEYVIAPSEKDVTAFNAPYFTPSGAPKASESPYGSIPEVDLDSVKGVLLAFFVASCRWQVDNWVKKRHEYTQDSLAARNSAVIAALAAKTSELLEPYAKPKGYEAAAKQAETERERWKIELYENMEGYRQRGNTLVSRARPFVRFDGDSVADTHSEFTPKRVRDEFAPVIPMLKGLFKLYERYRNGEIDINTLIR